MQLQSKIEKNGTTCFFLKGNDSKKLIAISSPWETGFSMERFDLNGRPSKWGVFTTYDLDLMETVAQSWAEAIVGEEVNIQE